MASAVLSRRKARYWHLRTSGKFDGDGETSPRPSENIIEINRKFYDHSIIMQFPPSSSMTMANHQQPQAWASRAVCSCSELHCDSRHVDGTVSHEGIWGWAWGSDKYQLVNEAIKSNYVYHEPPSIYVYPTQSLEARINHLRLWANCTCARRGGGRAASRRRAAAAE